MRFAGADVAAAHLRNASALLSMAAVELHEVDESAGPDPTAGPVADLVDGLARATGDLADHVDQLATEGEPR